MPRSTARRPWSESQHGTDPRYPHELSHRDWTVLLCHPDGAIVGDDGCGLYHHDCRILSGYRLTLDAAEPDWVSSDAVEGDTWAATVRAARPGGSPNGPDLLRTPSRCASNGGSALACLSESSFAITV